MLKFGLGALLKGEEPTAADAQEPAQNVEETAAPPPPGPYIYNREIAAGDFESPGIVPNPDYFPDDEDLNDFERPCRLCGDRFVSSVVRVKAKAGFRPSVCSRCDVVFKERLLARCPLHNPSLVIARPRYYPGVPQKDDYFCGFVLTDPQNPLNTRNTETGFPVTATKMKSLQSTPPDVSPSAPAVEISSSPATTGPSGHAKHGPSSLKHKEACAHWRNTGGTNEVAEEGTMMHGCLETRDLSGLNEEQANCVSLVRSFFDAKAAELGDGAIVMQERRMNVADLTWGTADELQISVDGRLAKILDAKFGRIPVDDASINLQGISYAAAVFHEFPAVQEVEVCFAQPRCDEISTHTFVRSTDYGWMVERVRKVIEAAEDPNSPYNPGPENCQYCGNRATCPALLQVANTVAQRAYGEFIIPEELTPQNIVDPAIMSKALVVAEILEKWCDEVKKHGRTMALEGADIPGYELKHRSSPRVITEPALAWESVKDCVSPEDFIKAVKGVSIGELETVFAASAPRGKKAQAKQELEDRLRDASCLRDEGTVPYLKRCKSAAPQVAALPQ